MSELSKLSHTPAVCGTIVCKRASVLKTSAYLLERKPSHHRFRNVAAFVYTNAELTNVSITPAKCVACRSQCAAVRKARSDLSEIVTTYNCGWTRCHSGLTIAKLSEIASAPAPRCTLYC